MNRSLPSRLQTANVWYSNVAVGSVDVVAAVAGDVVEAVDVVAEFDAASKKNF